jgi:ParB family chromosome partitioning protein
MQVPIESIKVKERIREEMGDISALAESMKRFGQISPILISSDKVLIAGGRRLEAARSLGWNSINAVIAEITDELTMLEYEREENIQRANFTPTEEATANEKIHELRNPPLFRRVWNAIVRFFRRIFKRKKN